VETIKAHTPALSTQASCSEGDDITAKEEIAQGRGRGGSGIGDLVAGRARGVGGGEGGGGGVVGAAGGERETDGGGVRQREHDLQCLRVWYRVSRKQQGRRASRMLPSNYLAMPTSGVEC
jgi:hypothetical protein